MNRERKYEERKRREEAEEGSGAPRETRETQN